MIEALDLIDNKDVRKEFGAAFEKLDRIELIQLFSDLKYLPYKAFDDGFVDDPELESAITRFRADLHNALHDSAASNLHQIKLESEVLEPEDPVSKKLTRREVYILKEIVGLDNELILHDIKEGECTLLSRVLIYRYRVYDLIRSVLPNHKLTTTVIKKLKKSAKEIGFKNGWLALGNLLANQEEVSMFCLKSPILSKKIFGYCIFIETISKEGQEVISNLGDDIKTKQRFLFCIDSKEVKKPISDLIHFKDRKAVSSQVDKYIENIANKVMRRILQVKLWTMGLYQGELDHDFGPLSVGALSDYLQTIIENEKDGKKELGKIIYNLGNNQCIVNIRYLLTNHFLPVEKANTPHDHSSVSKVYDFVLEDKSKLKSVKDASRKDRKEVVTGSKNIKSQLEDELRSESKRIITGKERKVRQYKAKTGIMKFFSKLYKWAKNAISKLIKLIKRLLQLIKKSIKFIYTEIKEAFQNFRDGINFLFSNRIINPTTSITTDYDFDFDGVTKIHTKPTTEEIKLHTASVKRFTSAIYPALNFVRVVIQWGLSIATGIGWVKVLVGIAKLFKEMLSKRIRAKMVIG